MVYKYLVYICFILKNCFFSVFEYFFFNLFIFRERGKERERERNINVWLLLVSPHWGPGHQPRHVP